MGRSVAGLAAVLTIAGCQGGSADRTAPAVSDSAGVRFIEHPPADAPLFELGAAPRLLLTPGESELPLYRVVGGYIDPAGGFVVADAGNYRLIRWSESGAFESSSGSQGRGPGEFENITWLQPTSTGSAVYDSRTRRISWFDPDPEFVASVQFNLPRPEPPTDDGIVASGAVLGVIESSRIIGYPGAAADPQGTAGPLPLAADVTLYDSAVSRIREIGRFTLIEWYEDPSRQPVPLANRMEAPRFHWFGRDDLFVVADAARHRVDVLQSGSRKTVIVEARARLPFAPDSLPEMFQLAADSLQAYRDVRVDAARRVWLRPATTEGHPSTRWRVFTEDGRRVGDLELPTDATVLDASENSLLLLRRSELDEETLEIWDLTEPG